jgi:hypothetical protein
VVMSHEALGSVAGANPETRLKAISQYGTMT